MLPHGRMQLAVLTVCCVILAAAAEAQRGGGFGGGGAPGGGGGRAYGSGLMGDAVIEYDPDTGTLMVITDEDTNFQIGRLIEMLDKPVPQVLIKVLFLEVTHSDGLDLGVEAFFNFENETDIVGNFISSKSAGTDFGVAGLTTGGFYSLLKTDLELTIHALAEVGKLEVLSRPSILVRNNEEAIITIGQEVPFIRNSQITNLGQIINTVEYEDIGIILQVTPFINAEDLVEMSVATEISTLTGDSITISPGVEAPVFAKRSAETRVVVPSGRTVVIGGLMEDNETETTRKVPILGSIPILGNLFRRKITSKSKTELMIFLTPHVVRGAEELGEMSRSEHSSTELTKEVFSEEEMRRYVGDFGTEVAPAEPRQN